MCKVSGLDDLVLLGLQLYSKLDGAIVGRGRWWPLCWVARLCAIKVYRSRLCLLAFPYIVDNYSKTKDSRVKLLFIIP
jgi:hypothetical protein